MKTQPVGVTAAARAHRAAVAALDAARCAGESDVGPWEEAAAAADALDAARLAARAMAFTARVRGDIFDAGLDEDGQQRLGESFSVLAEDAAGNRWASYRRFRAVTPGARDGARRDAEAYRGIVERALARGGDPRTSAKWSRVEPRHASPAWAQHGEADQCYREDDLADTFTRAAGGR